jgi:3',5'-cyclic AMP phosphodiesterase CpdA
MNRRKFLKKAGQTGALISTVNMASCINQKALSTKHNWSDYEATIEISGIKSALTVLHITDSHISVLDEKEKEFHPFGKRIDDGYKTVSHYKTGLETTAADSFMELMNLAKNKKVDVIALTGDIVNNPSKSSVKFVTDAIRPTGIQSIYVAGNHDWHYEGMEGTATHLRQTWINNSLLPLYGGKNPLYSSTIIGGINFVTIDNSIYQVNEEQLAFFKEQQEKNEPIILLMHMPVYLPKDAERDGVSTIGDPRWGWEIDDGYEIERRIRWSKDGNLPSTMEFVETVKNCENLGAVLVGHTHRARADKISETAVQYVTGRSVDGQHRIVKFKPLG